MKIFFHSRPIDQLARPWKNGGGESVQLAIYPSHASMEKEDFYWRVSRARIDQSGPFSEFVGFSRGLVQLSGEPMRLGGKKLARFEPFLFTGDQAIRCELGPGQATGARDVVFDVNVLVNRAWGQFKMSNYLLEKGRKLARYGDFVAYYCHEGELEVDGVKVLAGELVVLEEDSMIQALSDANVIVIELTENAQFA